MTDAAPRPLTGLELARAALLGLTAGIVGAPLLSAIQVPEQPEGLAPLAPAWLARAGSLALVVGLACLGLPRLLRRGPVARPRLRAQVAARLALLLALGGAIGAPALASLLLRRSPDGDPFGVFVLGFLLVPCGAVAGGALGGAIVRGKRGRVESARYGAGLGFVACGLALGGSCLLAGALASDSSKEVLLPALASVWLAVPMFLAPALFVPHDAFHDPRLPSQN